MSKEKSILDGPCLKLNAQWVPIDIITVRKAIEDACAPTQAKFIRMIDEYPVVLTIEEWLQLEPFDGEQSIRIARDKVVPAPRVSICSEYNKVRAKAVPFNLLNLARRYSYMCAVTGKPLIPEEYSREHVDPRSKGGKSGWDHEVLMDRKTNNRRGNRDYESLGLKRPKILGPPPPQLPVHALLRDKCIIPEWRLFLPV